MAVTLSDEQYKRRVVGCWLGKSIGGTLGMPYEGVRQTLSLTYYDPVPTQMLPNDDVDAQVIYAVLLDRMDQPRVDRHVLSAAWQHIGMSADEYGICKRNLRLGLLPPVTGSYDNPFTRGMGAAIRTEIWACLAPGQPELAAAYAYEDACMDHDGEGIHAAVFIAAMQSMAFVERDTDVILDRAMQFIPHESELHAALTDTRRWWAQTGDWAAVQQRLADRYLTDNFTDVVINVSYIVLGWLAGRGDFGRAICAAVNAGQDTDCTGATLGALLGILDPDGMDERWLAPIGRELVLSDSVHDITHPPTIDVFVDLLMDLRNRLAGARPQVEEVDQETDHLAIVAEIGFGSGNCLPEIDVAPSPPAAMQPTTFPGHFVTLPVECCMGELVWVRYRVHLAQTQSVGLLFNTPAPMRLWVDRRGVLSRDGGAFVPAMHRAPRNQFATMTLSAGEHELLAVMRKPQSGALIWCVGLCDRKPRPVDSDWLIEAFPRVGHSVHGEQAALPRRATNGALRRAAVVDLAQDGAYLRS